jgi:hypothetical protein
MRRTIPKKSNPHIRAANFDDAKATRAEISRGLTPSILRRWRLSSVLRVATLANKKRHLFASQYGSCTEF